TLAALGDMATMLDAPESHEVVDLEAAALRLSALRRRIEAGFAPDAIDALSTKPAAPGEVLAAERLLATPLPAAADRLRLVDALPETDAAVAGSYGTILFPDPPAAPLPPSQEEWRGLREVVVLQTELARLAASPSLAGDNAEASPARAALLRDFENIEASARLLEQRFVSSPAAADDDALRWEAYEAFGAALAAFERRLPDFIERTPMASGLTDAAKRPATLAQLRAAERALRLLPARDAAAVHAAPLLDTLAAAQWRDYWLWRRQRLLEAVNDAGELELAELRRDAHAYRLLAEAVSLSPPVPPFDPPLVTIETPTSLALSAESPRDFEATIRLAGASPASIWVLLKYDPLLLEVRLTPEDQALREHDFLVADDDYPLRPDRQERPATFVMQGGEEQTLQFRVTAAGAAAFPTRLIIKAVAVEPPLGEGDANRLLAYVRKTIDVTLPLPQTLDIVVRGSPGTWTPQADGYRFHPFPNRETEYRLGLANRLDRDRRVNVEFAVASASVAEPLPAGELTAEEAQSWSEQFELSPPIASIQGLPLPADAAWVALPFPSPPEEKPAAPAEAESPSPDKPMPAGPPAAVTSTAFTAPVAVPREVLVTVTDRESGHVWLRRLAISPQRPRRYVRPEVSYDPVEERVEVRVVADDPALLPPGGARVQAEFVPPLSAEAEARTEGRVDVAAGPAVLYAALPASHPEVMLRLQVDDFPRAFLYRIDPSRAVRDILEDTDALAARVIALPDGVKYPVPAPAFPVTVEIDAPPGSFQSAADVVEIGVDRDRDREFVGDHPLTFAADRQVAASLQRVGPGGAMAIAAQVTDFRVNLPDPGLQNAKANVLAHVVAGGREAWSEPVEVTFDAGPPIVKKLELTPGREAVVGSELDIRLWCDDHQLSGVQKVEAALDVNRNGEIPADPPPVEAAPGERGLWTAKLPLPKPGAYTLLVRMTDEVGNVRVLPQGSIHIIAPEELAARKAAEVNRVAGVVVYGDQPQPDIEVQLESETGFVIGPVRTGEDGRFEFPRVPVGAYKITAGGLVRGAQRVYPYDGEDAAITVDPPPKAIPALRLSLKTRRSR
ncbi:MAG: hypothetical protein KY475_12655, partial [Planctomycetes bacterium]|nr:hypothetical protein [Planctomycetota bacterium]